MRSIGILLATLFLACACLPAQETSHTYALDRTSHDFGTLKTNRAAETVFYITNHGSAPLVILEAKVSCNCVKVEYPRQPVKPEESVEIKIIYKDKDPGAFYKTVELITNGTPRRTQLRLKGTVEK